MRIADSLTDQAIQTEIGSRVEASRLERNLTQSQLAERAGVSRATVERLESGESVQMTSFIRVLRAFGTLDRLEQLLPEPEPGPIALLRARGRTRRRASGARRRNDGSETWTWGDEE